MNGVAKILFAACLSFNFPTGENAEYCNSETFDIFSLREYVDSVDASYFSSVEKSKNAEQIPDTRRIHYGNVYKQCFLEKPLESAIHALSQKELNALYAVLRKIAFYTASRLVLDDIKDVVLEKQGRGEDVDDLIIDLHKGYISAGEFDRAKELERQYPKLIFHELPAIDLSNTGEINLLEVDGESRSIVSKPFSFPATGHLVVVASPLCSPSSRFSSWLLDSPEFLPAFISHATMMTPPSGALYVEEISRFNGEGPVQMYIAYKERQWSEIDNWSTPSFYFFNNGRLVTYFSGWPPEGKVEMLRQGFESVAIRLDQDQ